MEKTEQQIARDVIQRRFEHLVRRLAQMEQDNIHPDPADVRGKEIADIVHQMADMLYVMDQMK